MMIRKFIEQEGFVQYLEEWMRFEKVERTDSVILGGTKLSSRSMESKHLCIYV